MVVNWYGDDILNAIDGETNAALFAAAELMINAAAAKAPRDEGTLAESGYVATKDKSTYHFDPASYEKEVRPEKEGAPPTTSPVGSVPKEVKLRTVPF
jgi:hypothetical protein